MAEKLPNGRYGDVQIAGWRDEYVTGDESLVQLAQRVGVSSKALERHALNRKRNGGKTWGDLRDEFRDDVSREVQEKIIDSAGKTLARVKEKSANVAKLALEALERRLSTEMVHGVETRDLVNAAKLATAIKIELSGDPNGVPVDVRASLDDLTVEELRKLAEGS